MAKRAIPKKKHRGKTLKVKLTPDYYHEACDRAYVAMEFVNMSLWSHPVIQQDKELKTIIEDVQGKLWHIYQITGSKM